MQRILCLEPEQSVCTYELQVWYRCAVIICDYLSHVSNAPCTRLSTIIFIQVLVCDCVWNATTKLTDMFTIVRGKCLKWLGKWTNSYRSCKMLSQISSMLPKISTIFFENHMMIPFVRWRWHLHVIVTEYCLDITSKVTYVIIILYRNIICVAYHSRC